MPFDVEHIFLPLGWEDSPEGGPGNPLQYSCLENPMDREAWQATAHGVEKSWTEWRDFHFTPTLAGEFFTTEPPGKPSPHIIIFFFGGENI